MRHERGRQEPGTLSSPKSRRLRPRSGPEERSHTPRTSSSLNVVVPCRRASPPAGSFHEVSVCRAVRAEPSICPADLVDPPPKLPPQQKTQRRAIVVSHSLGHLVH